MAEIEIDIDLVCDKCKKPVEGSWYRYQLYIEPCEECMNEAENNGYEEAKNENQD